MQRQVTKSESKALALYVSLSRDIGDFLEEVTNCEDLEVLQLLHQLLVTPNPDMTLANRKKNLEGAPIVAERIVELGAKPRIYAVIQRLEKIAGWSVDSFAKELLTIMDGRSWIDLGEIPIHYLGQEEKDTRRYWLAKSKVILDHLGLLEVEPDPQDVIWDPKTQAQISAVLVNILDRGGSITPEQEKDLRRFLNV